MGGPAKPVLLVLLLLGAALAGCLGVGQEAADEPVTKQQAEVTQALGGIQGVVTDNAIQPVAGANVTLLPANETVRTASDGSYAFSRIDPGTYDLVVRVDGFVSTREEGVVVSAGEPTNVDFIVTHLISDEAYTQQFEMVGFVECGISWQEAVVGLPPGIGYQSVAVCAVVNLFTGANATNDRFMHFFELEAPVDTMVYEMAWESSGAFSGTSLWSVLEVRGFTNVNGSRFFDAQGQSPILVRLDKAHFEDMAQNFTDRCGDGDDEWCGQNFWDAGWPMQVRVFAHWGCQSTPVKVCVVAQQEFSHYVSAFYNAPAPEGYRVTEA